MTGGLLVLWITLGACPPLAGSLPVAAKLALCSTTLDMRAARTLEASHAIVERTVPAQSLASIWKRSKGRWRLVESIVK